MNNKFRKQKVETQIQWKNIGNDATFNPWKKYYSVIKIGDTSYLTEYESKFRSEAVAVFHEEARLAGGYVENIGVFK